MHKKHTLLPIILALAIGGCSNSTPQYYPNFQACYNDLGDANDCIQYIQEPNSNTYSNTAPDDSVSSLQSVDNDSGIDGSSALTGAAVGAAAGYVAGSTINKNNSTSPDKQRQDRVYAAGTNTSRSVNNNKSTANNNSKTNLSKSSSSKSSTSRSGFGSTGSKSFGG